MRARAWTMTATVGLITALLPALAPARSIRVRVRIAARGEGSARLTLRFASSVADCAIGSRCS